MINTFIVSLNIASSFSAKRTSSFFLLLAQYQRYKMATTKELIYQQFESFWLADDSSERIHLLAFPVLLE